ncbi:methyltransferase family protein [Aureimonas mangrovi]|uniref:methyltransferase family protein n=1 Tax=Aureimonas mangrovi TaxID=2758041 RepID=UPI00163D5574|nr:isoprenylcysteine carboxylmethyltransferase family protein [Aureimonas mangrovi]
MALTQYQRRRRHILAAMIVAAFAALVTVQSAWNYTGHEAVESIGLALILAGILGRIWCTFYIGGRKAAEIVDIGPYSISRNPLYVFSSIAAAGVGAQTGSIILALVFFGGAVAAFHMVIRKEEAFLAEKFGATYTDYIARVPRFWPAFGRFRDAQAVSVPLSRVYTTLADGLVFLLAIPAFELIEELQETGAIIAQASLY